jgi:hypothetical protein
LRHEAHYPAEQGGNAGMMQACITHRVHCLALLLPTIGSLAWEIARMMIPRGGTRARRRYHLGP